MAEHRHDDVRRRGGTRKRSLAARLRHEARGCRPGFSPALHGRVVAAVAAPAVVRAANDLPATAVAPPLWRRQRAAGLLITAACVAVALVVAGVRSQPQRPSLEDGVDLAGVAGGPGIERLPTPAEIGEGVLAEVTTLAVAAVGVPAWSDLAAFDPASFVPGDDASR
ncbi:MAG: hypothetical protein ACKOYJ_11260 [Planctomycetia bacterium]